MYAFGLIETGFYRQAEKHALKVGKRCLAGAMLDLVDASSLLCRLQMEGVDANDRWRELFHLRESHTDDHILVFNAVHMLMCTLGAKKEDATLNLLMSLRDYVRNGSGTNCEVSREVGLALCEAFEQADKGNFDRAVDILNPLRYDVVDIGASNAQQDIFNLFLIHAALHSSLKEHHHLAR
ncbi:Tetratricopeptide repeat protein 38 [Stylophora pistillata]|uniref:Tetratricopeptide repeat protein 38 n=1 Tax=Stylophora pistillata TaxID=50429 RepID=A0A2B4RDH9_STYPI|nr:Tetratricopeptide repeat protein 38 [Stylophora pistillata]